MPVLFHGAFHIVGKTGQLSAATSQVFLVFDQGQTVLFVVDLDFRPESNHLTKDRHLERTGKLLRNGCLVEFGQVLVLFIVG
jgi:hypothetical protein